MSVVNPIEYLLFVYLMERKGQVYNMFAREAAKKVPPLVVLPLIGGGGGEKAGPRWKRTGVETGWGGCFYC